MLVVIVFGACINTQRICICLFVEAITDLESFFNCNVHMHMKQNSVRVTEIKLLYHFMGVMC